MIWFACAKCNKVHGRPENAIGSMIFCDCGQGLTVPWESTSPEPAHLPAAATPPMGRLEPRVEPLSFGGSSVPVAPAPLPPPRSSRRGARFQNDPNFCFNHEARPKQKVCDDCGLSFCDDCALTFRGQTLCGPCKNFEAKVLQRPPQTSSLAIVSVLIALAAGPLLFCLVSMGANRGVHVLGLIALAPQLLAFLAGFFALRRSQADPRLGGQGLAITGMLTASFTAVLTVALTLQGMRV